MLLCDWYLLWTLIMPPELRRTLLLRESRVSSCLGHFYGRQARRSTMQKQLDSGCEL